MRERARVVTTKSSQSLLGCWSPLVNDLDDVAVLQLVAERHDLAVDARARTVLADLGVNRVGEVDRRRAAREDAHVALRREHVDLVGEEVDLHALEELDRVLDVLLELDQLAQPAELLRVLRIDAAAVRSLYFQCAAMPCSATRCISCVRIWISMRWRPGPMTVVCSDWYMFGFGQRDVVLEAARDRRPLRVDDAERRVAVGHATRRRRGTRGCRRSARSRSVCSFIFRRIEYRCFARPVTSAAKPCSASRETIVRQTLSM